MQEWVLLTKIYLYATVPSWDIDFSYSMMIKCFKILSSPDMKLQASNINWKINPTKVNQRQNIFLSLEILLNCSMVLDNKYATCQISVGPQMVTSVAGFLRN